jgi:Ca2+-binding RTX toxin-like protein
VADDDATGRPTDQQQRRSGAVEAATTVSGAPASRPTLSTALDARRARLGDSGMLQFRARLEGALPGAGTDAPPAPAATRPSISLRRSFGLAGDIGPSDPKSALLAQTTTPEGFVKNADGTWTFTGNGDASAYTVSQDANGRLIVRNETTGQEYALDGGDAAAGVYIDAGDGDDTVTIADGVTAPVALIGGAGNDVISAERATTAVAIDGGDGDDNIIGSAGNDTIWGSAGNDTVDGAAGDDVLWGHAGDDTITGGDGNDSLEGGDGNDRLDGAAGNDQLLGQLGDDEVIGGDGEDLLMGGAGADTISGNAGGDAIYGDATDLALDAGADAAVDVIVAENGSIAATGTDASDGVYSYDPAAVDAWLAAHPEFRIEGSEDFVARSRADIGVMLTTDQGTKLLDDVTAGLRANGETLTIREKVGAPGGTHSSDVEQADGSYTNEITVGMWSGLYSDGTNRMPLPAFFHELVHAYQSQVAGYPDGHSTFSQGGKARNTERQATGLPWIDENGVVHPGDELAYTDNKFRAELGLPQRTTYGGEQGDPDGYEEKDEGGTQQVTPADLLEQRD